MSVSQPLSRLLVASCLAVAAPSGARAQAEKPFQPQVGQAGKDVIWVPTSQVLVDKMLDLAKVTPNDYVIDLGSGDGRTVITAAKRGARALGIEYNPDMVELSQRNAEQAGVAERAKFMKADLFETDFSDATVITMFLLPSINLRLRPKILDLKPGTRVVSNSFDMGDWPADDTTEATAAEGCTSYCKAFFWVVPAKVEGAWQMPEGDLLLTQKYQMVSGTLKLANNVIAPVTNGKLKGDQITFKAGDAEYTGRVTGDTIEGIRKSGGGEAPWRASRRS